MGADYLPTYRPPAGSVGAETTYLPQSEAAPQNVTGTFSPSRRGPSFLTTALHLGSSKADFDSFLRLTFGIEHNTFSVEDAKAAARSHGGSWDDCCESWLSCGSSLLSVICRFGVAPAARSMHRETRWHWSLRARNMAA